MKTRTVLARIAGSLYILLGAVNLLGLLVPEVREQVISIGATVFRYGGFVAVGIGLLFLRKWSVYLWGALMVINGVLVYTVYGGQTLNLSGAISLLPLVGPFLIIAFFYYIWPALKPSSSQVHGNVA
ncbi:hypothetical protein ACJJIU_13200 [Microbulbifer sp. CnH-101-E]|uniref:hypothetical protein n=1 Tax=unclassified Microbulbifer TaxID=2619833 RepID=UPI00403915CE